MVSAFLPVCTNSTLNNFAPRRSAIFAAITALFFVAAINARADINWDGENAVGDFSIGQNWYFNTTPTWGFGSGNLVFNFRNNASQTSQYYNLGDWNSINDIIWETTWGTATTLAGNANGINFNQRLENRSSHKITITMNLSGAKNGASQIELNPVNGDMELSGNLYNDNAKPYFTYGDNGKLITINTGLSYASSPGSVSYTIAGNSKVLFTAAQGWTGAVNVQKGELWIGTGGSLSSGTVNLGLNNSDTAKFYLRNSGVTYSGGINVTNNGGSKVLGGINDSGTSTFSGKITNNSAGGLILENTTAGGTVQFSDDIVGTGSISIAGLGTVLMTGAKTYTGKTTISSGTLSVSADSGLGAGPASLVADQLALGGGTLAVTTGFTMNANRGIRLNSGGGAINVAANQTLTVQSAVTGANALTKSGSGVLVLSNSGTSFGTLNADAGSIAISENAAITGLNGSGTVDIASTKTLTLTTGANFTFGGTLTGGGTFTKAGNSELFLTGASSLYTGAINISAGALEAQSSSALGTSAGGVTVANNASFKLYNASSDLTFGDAFNINGLGTTGGGAILSTGGNNTINGNITLSGNSRIGVNNTGRAGSLTLAGSIAAGANTLYVGGNQNITLSGNLSGDKSTGDFALFIDGSATTTISGADNSGLTGTVRSTNSGTLLLGSANALGSGQWIISPNTTPTIASTDATARSIGNSTTFIYSSLTLGQSSGGTGSLTFGAVDLGNDPTGDNARTITTAANTSHSFGAVSGNNSNRLIKAGAGTLTLSAASTTAGGVQLNNGVLLVGNNSALGTGTLQVQFDQSGTRTLASSSSASYTLANNVNIFNSMTLGQTTGGTGSLTLSGTVSLGDPVGEVNSRTVTVNGAHTISGVIGGGNGLVKAGSGTLTLSGASANTYTGLTTVSGGVLELNKTTGNAIIGATTINSGAVLLLSASNQVDSGAGDVVTLSGGTIRRGAGVSEAFGNLNVTAQSFLDFGTGALASGGYALRFETYTASALLNVQNFLPGNKLQFASGFNAALLPTGGNLSNANFSFSTGFTTGTEDGYFTITAIPEPSTYLAAAGLLAMFLWPVRRRLIKDAKSILGLRPSGRDRIEAYRNA